MRAREPREPAPSPAAIIPTNVLRALISQSRKRCASYVEMMQKLGQGLGQLDLEAQQMVRGRERDPEVMGQLREYFGAVRELSEQNEQHVAQLIHQEVQFQGVLQTWLYGRPLEVRHPDASPRQRPLRNGPVPGQMGMPPFMASQRRAPIGPPPYAPPAEPSDEAMIIPPPQALAGYAAHAAGKIIAARQAATPAPSPARATAKPQVQAPPAASLPKIETHEEVPLPKPNGPAPAAVAARLIEEKPDPEPSPAPAEGGEGAT